MDSDKVRPGRSSSNSIVSNLRQRVQGIVLEPNVIVDLRRAVLCGAIHATNVKSYWRSPTWRLCIYVSSANCDTQFERDILFKQFLPIARRGGYQSGISVEFIDLLPGISSDVDLDCNSWEYRKSILEKCRDQSMGLYFLSLLSNKYGKSLLPRCILKADYERAANRASDNDRLFLEEFYGFDENAENPNYKLKAYTENADYVSRLVKTLDNTLADANYCDELECGKSLQEWELKSAFSNVIDKSRLFWIHRTIEDATGSNSNEKSKYTDDGPAASQLGVLIRWAQRKFDATTALHLPAISLIEAIEKEANWTKYVTAFKHGLKEILQDNLGTLTVQRNSWDLDGCGVGIPGEEATEMLFHSEKAFDICNEFVGRDKILNEALAKIVKSRDTVEADTLRTMGVEVGPLEHIALAVIGAEGTGKSYIMAKLFEMYYNHTQGDRLVLIRFCGATAHSSTGLELLHSLCSQIHFALDKKHNKGLYSGSYEDSIVHFHSLMLSYSIVIFLDGLDHLYDENFSRSQLSFLKGIVLHPDSRIIVSTRPDQHDIYSNKWVAYYGCESRLREEHIARVFVRKFQLDAETTDELVYQDEIEYESYHLSATHQQSEDINALDNFNFEVNIQGVTISNVSPMKPSIIEREDAGAIIDAIFAKQGRKIQITQKREILRASTRDPRMITLRLLCNICLDWSSTVLPSLPLGGFDSIIAFTLEEIDKKFNAKIMDRVCGYIALSLRGISDNEMIDLLSLEPAILTEVNTLTSGQFSRFPSHIWYRIREELGYLLTNCDEASCMMFRNQCIIESILTIRLDELQIGELHKRMAMYFGDLIRPEDRSVNGIISQPLLLNKSTQSSVWSHTPIINKRRCLEAAHHMLKCGMYQQAMIELCDIESVCARAKCGLGFFLLTQLIQLSALYQNPRILHYIRWLAKSMGKISMDPTWYIVMTCTEQPYLSTARKDLMLILHSSNQYDKFCKENWVRCSHIGGKADFGAMITGLAGHTNRVSCLAWSPDGSSLISGSWDKSICIWNPHTWTLINRCEGHGASVTSVTWNPNNSQFASSSWDNTVAIWDVESGQVDHVFEDHTDFVCAVVWSPNGKYLASGSYDTTVRLWLPSTGTAFKVLEGHTNWVSALAWSPDSMLLASGSSDRSIMVWYVTFGAWKQTMRSHAGGITSLAWNKDGTHIAAGSIDKSVSIWDVYNAAGPLFTIPMETAVNYVGWNDTGKKLSISASEGNMRIWSLADNVIDCKYELHDEVITALCWSPQGTTLVTGLTDGNIHMWDAAVLNQPETIELHKDGILQVCCSTDGRFIASASMDFNILIWDTQSGKLASRMQYHTNHVIAICWSPDSKYLLSASTDNKVIIWDINTGMPFNVERFSDMNKNYCTCVAWHNSKGVIAQGCALGDIRILNPTSSEVIKTVKPHAAHVTCVAFNPIIENQLATSSRDNTVIILNWTTGLIVTKFEIHRNWVTGLSWKADGKVLSSVSLDKTLHIWDIENRCELVDKKYVHSYPLTSVAWNAYSEEIVLGCTDGCVYIWDISNVKVKAPGSSIGPNDSGENTDDIEAFALRGHDKEVTSVCWSADGLKIISGSLDASVRVWDAVKYTEIVSRESELMQF